MPQSFNIEGYGPVEFPDDFTPQQIQQVLDREIKPKLKGSQQQAPRGDWRHPVLPKQPEPPKEKLPQVGAAESFGIGAASNVLPGYAMSTAAAGLEAAFAPETLGGSLLLIPPTLFAGWLANKIQQKGIQKFMPDVEKYQQAAEEQHGWATGLGAIAAFSPYAKFAPGQIFREPFKKAVLPAAIGATIGAVQPAVEGRAPTGRDITLGALGALGFGEPYEYVKGPAGKLVARLKGARDASKVSEAAKVHGDVLQQPGKEGVPTEGGVAGVPAQAQERVSLTPEDKVLLNKAVEKQGKKEALTPEEQAVVNKAFGSPEAEAWKSETKKKYEEHRKTNKQAPPWEKLSPDTQQKVAKILGVDVPAKAPAAEPAKPGASPVAAAVAGKAAPAPAAAPAAPAPEAPAAAPAAPTPEAAPAAAPAAAPETAAAPAVTTALPGEPKPAPQPAAKPRVTETKWKRKVGDKYDPGMPEKVITGEDKTSGTLDPAYTKKIVSDVHSDDEISIETHDMTDSEIAAEQERLRKQNEIAKSLGLP